MSERMERRTFALPRSVAPDAEIFAIGDIHGRTDLLGALLDEAARQPRRREKRAIVFLGDLVDRGPDSHGAIDLAVGAAARVGADEWVGLMGNHETMMRLALDSKTPWNTALDAFETWLMNGGDRVIAQLVGEEALADDAETLLTAARAAVPERVFLWLASLRTNWRSGDVLFVHAGVNPRVDLDAFLAVPWDTPLDKLDEDRHWAWVRSPFLDHRPGRGGFSGLFVVHGHTPNDARRGASHKDQVARFRLNLDAGSGQTGTAKMAIIRGAEAEVVSVSGPTNRELARG